ncbi:MAG TPA: flagellar biosynthesis anti-sigma factor FlgM [Gemmatimonadaceae bacterium]|nr:flagellar biosynthesis anti-sigma factor FlgM [Gemmatimonadaceae bacterium]
MQINGKNRIDPTALGGIKPGATERSAPTRRTDAAATPERPKQDTVSFSDEARALASGASTRAAASPERIDDVKQRILLGAYNTAEMAGEVAKRILQRGEL